jgi:hypothetical protein
VESVDLISLPHATRRENASLENANVTNTAAENLCPEVGVESPVGAPRPTSLQQLGMKLLRVRVVLENVDHVLIGGELLLRLQARAIRLFQKYTRTMSSNG